MNIPYGRQHITEADVQAVIAALKSDFLTQGPRIAEFETAFAQYVGAEYAVAVSNGTAALHLAAMALGADQGSRVLTTPITFAASANCVLYCGGEIDFVDIDPATALMDLDLLEAKLKEAPAGAYDGVVVVDFAGAVVDLQRLRRLADEHGLWIIEDACHAPGGFFVDTKGTRWKCGGSGLADCSVFSFHPVKHIACGEGGMITTNSREVYQKLLLLRTHGITKDTELLSENHGGWYYEMQDLGYNYRITDFQAALGLSQLQRAEAGLERRRQIAAIYDEAFADTAVKPLATETREGHAFHLYVVNVPDRKGLYDHLRAQGIFSQVHYIPVHLLPFYRRRGHSKGELPKAEAYYESCLSLPMFPSLRDEEVEYVVAQVANFYE